MSINVNPIAAQVQAKMNAVDANTSSTQMAVLNYMATGLKAAGVSIDRTAFDLVLINVTGAVGSSTELNDMAKMMASIEKDFVDIRHRTIRWDAPGAYSWTVPDDVYVVWVTGVAGGGAGGHSVGSTSNPGNPGGAGGAAGMGVIRYPIYVQPGDIIQVVVGQGGVKGTSSANATAGTATSFSIPSHAIFLGGGPAGKHTGVPGYAYRPRNSADNLLAIVSGDGGANNQGGVHCEFNLGGGASSYTNSYSIDGGGGGGASPFGNGGNGGANASKNGLPGLGPGAGGGGAYRDGQGHDGGDGRDGFALLEY